MLRTVVVKTSYQYLELSTDILSLQYKILKVLHLNKMMLGSIKISNIMGGCEGLLRQKMISWKQLRQNLEEIFDTVHDNVIFSPDQPVYVNCNDLKSNENWLNFENLVSLQNTSCLKAHLSSHLIKRDLFRGWGLPSIHSSHATSETVIIF